MKKTLWLCLAPILIMAVFMSCSEGEKDSTGNTSKSAQDGISDSQYCGSFDAYYYDSIVELYQGLRDFDPNELDSISFMENQYMDDTRAKTHISEDEERNGIFGTMLNKLLTEKTLMFPYYRGTRLPLYEFKGEFEGASSIVITPTGPCRKPWINFTFEVNGDSFPVYTMYFDESLMNEANEKGASWLMAQLYPNGTNVHNYEKSNFEIGRPNRLVYEKEYQLGDRNVMAMVIDNSLEGFDYLGVYFVYDDILVCIWETPENLESILPDITFREVYLPTNTPLRDEPGREGTIYSTKK